MPILRYSDESAPALGVSQEAPQLADELDDLQQEAVLAIAEAAVADSIRLALKQDGRSLRQLHRDSGLDPAFVSRLANGKNCEVSTLAKLAFALNRGLQITFV